MSHGAGLSRQMVMNEIVITGATGVVGRRAVRELLAAGHRVAGVTRSPRGRHLLEALGARAIDADVFDAASLKRAFAGSDAVVNLLTHIPAADRMAAPGAWDENDRLRREASAAIAVAARDAGAGRLVQESLALFYADGGGAWLDEDAHLATVWLDDAAAAVATRCALRSRWSRPASRRRRARSASPPASCARRAAGRRACAGVWTAGA
jgi:nucleoside-diphosphate-sugar epimerase